MSDTNDASQDEALAAIQAELESIKKKNSELLAEKAKWRKAEQDAKDAAEEAAATAASKSGDLESVKAAHARELKKLQEAMEASSNELKTIRVDNAIKSALNSNNVQPLMAPAVEALLKGMTSYEDGNALIQGKAIDEFAKTYFAKDGAHFVRAPDNAGTGAVGATKSNAGSIPTTWNLTRYTKMKEENPALAEVYKTQTKDKQ